jgi:hypothetical protein
MKTTQQLKPAPRGGPAARIPPDWSPSPYPNLARIGCEPVHVRWAVKHLIDLGLIPSSAVTESGRTDIYDIPGQLQRRKLVREYQER